MASSERTENDCRVESSVESIRWKWERLGFETPDEFKERRGEDWFAKGRNHRTWEDPAGRHFKRGIEREVRDDSDTLDIGDKDSDALSKLCVGRTIVKIEREPHSGEEWGDGENDVTITLDDGAVLHFSGWGYDASGLYTSYSPPKETSETEFCAFCREYRSKPLGIDCDTMGQPCLHVNDDVPPPPATLPPGSV